MSDLDLILSLFDGGDLLSLAGNAFAGLGAIFLVWGLVNALFGYKLFKIVLAITGFIVGVVIGLIVGVALGASRDMEAIIPVAALLGGILGAVLAVTLHKVGVFFAVGAMGFLIFYILLGIFPLALVLGIVCGIVGVILEKYAIIVSTALSGGSLTGMGLGLITGNLGGFVFVSGLLIGIGGIVFQLWLERPKPAAVAAAAVTASAAASIPTAVPYSGDPAPAPTAAPTAAPPSAPALSTVPHCPYCGNQLPRGASFCSKCGRMTVAESSGQTVFCRKCGAKISSSANFCGKCGAAR